VASAKAHGRPGPGRSPTGVRRRVAKGDPIVHDRAAIDREATGAAASLGANAAALAVRGSAALVAAVPEGARRAGRRAARGSRSREAIVLTHVVLFRPRPGLAPTDADSLVAAIERAARDIPAVRRFEVGRRTTTPPAYAAGAPPDFPFVAMVWVDDRAALEAYLAHPAHQALGAAFNAALGAALVFDFDTEMVDAGGAGRLLAQS
jgi:hypothetical protein